MIPHEFRLKMRNQTHIERTTERGDFDSMGVSSKVAALRVG